MKDGMMYKQKEIVLIPFPYTDLTGKKLRPALIISNEKLNKTDDRLCVLVTSKESQNSLKILKKHIKNNDLPFQSFVKAHRLFTIDKKIIIKSLCTITEEFHNTVFEEIKKYIN